MEGTQVTIQSADLWEDMPSCEQHVGGEIEDCGDCIIERDEAIKRLSKIQQSINDRLQGLAQQGVTMPDTVRHEIQLQVLLDMMIPTPRQGAIYQGEVMTRMLNSIKSMQEQIKRPSLHIARPGVDLSKIKP
jgi:hypothetical protein